MSAPLNIGDECYTENGTKCIFAGAIDGQNFVRILLTAPEADEWPSDRLTPAARLFRQEPEPVRGVRAAQVEEQITALLKQRAEIEAAIAELRKQDAALQKAMKDRPDVSLLLDFIEGKITHCVCAPSYGKWQIKTLEETVKLTNDYGRFKGMRLVGLFGTDEYGKQCKWAANSYQDGSGSWHAIHPVRSVEEAQEYVRASFEADLAAWRAGSTRIDMHQFKGFDFLEWPDDWLQHESALLAQARDKQIANLKAQIAVLEAQP